MKIIVKKTTWPQVTKYTCKKGTADWSEPVDNIPDFYRKDLLGYRLTKTDMYYVGTGPERFRKTELYKYNTKGLKMPNKTRTLYKRRADWQSSWQTIDESEMPDTDVHVTWEYHDNGYANLDRKLSALQSSVYDFKDCIKETGLDDYNGAASYVLPNTHFPHMEGSNFDPQVSHVVSIRMSVWYYSSGGAPNDLSELGGTYHLCSNGTYVKEGGDGNPHFYFNTTTGTWWYKVVAARFTGPYELDTGRAVISSHHTGVSGATAWFNQNNNIQTGTNTHKVPHTASDASGTKYPKTERMGIQQRMEIRSYYGSNGRLETGYHTFTRAVNNPAYCVHGDDGVNGLGYYYPMYASIRDMTRWHHHKIDGTDWYMNDYNTNVHAASDPPDNLAETLSDGSVALGTDNAYDLSAQNFNTVLPFNLLPVSSHPDGVNNYKLNLFTQPQYQ